MQCFAYYVLAAVHAASALTMSLKEGGGPVIRKGYLKKLKTNKKKYFVLRAETSESSARLDYYDSDKKFNTGQQPKRSIPLKTCFNINRKSDTKHKHVIALYTKDDCFCVVLENEEDLEAWLKALLSLQHGEDAADGETPRPTFGKQFSTTQYSFLRFDRFPLNSTLARFYFLIAFFAVFPTARTSRNVF